MGRGYEPPGGPGDPGVEVGPGDVSSWNLSLGSHFGL